MTTVKTISVIIAVHNAEPYLQASIESVLKQRWPHKELIIVDDGSTDRSFEIAKEAECKWIKVYIQPLLKLQKRLNVNFNPFTFSLFCNFKRG